MNNEERKKGPMWENKQKGEMENDARRHVAWEMRGKKEKEITGKKVVRSRGHLQLDRTDVGTPDNNNTAPHNNALLWAKLKSANVAISN